jgi:hypothetical protein
MTRVRLGLDRRGPLSNSIFAYRQATATGERHTNRDETDDTFGRGNQSIGGHSACVSLQVDFLFPQRGNRVHRHPPDPFRSADLSFWSLGVSGVIFVGRAAIRARNS